MKTQITLETNDQKMNRRIISQASPHLVYKLNVISASLFGFISYSLECFSSPWGNPVYFANCLLSSFSISSGIVGGPYLSTTCPSLSIKNFVKFHFMNFPSSPPFFAFIYFHRGWVSSPFTLILLARSNLTLYCSTNVFISSSVPGSCPPN